MNLKENIVLNFLFYLREQEISFSIFESTKSLDFWIDFVFFREGFMNLNEDTNSRFRSRNHTYVSLGWPGSVGVGLFEFLPFILSFLFFKARLQTEETKDNKTRIYSFLLPFPFPFPLLPFWLFFCFILSLSFFFWPKHQSGRSNAGPHSSWPYFIMAE